MFKDSTTCISLFTVAVSRLIVIALLCLAPFLSALAIGPGYSGTWYNPAQDGHGFSIEISELSDGTPVGIVIWYIYDDQGNPVFMVGEGAPYGNQLQVTFECPWGMEFGVFDPRSVYREDGGTGLLEFTGENSATFKYTPSTYMEQELGHSPINIPLVKFFDSPPFYTLPLGHIRYKDLVIGFTTDFKRLWDDKGSGAVIDGSFWEPLIPESDVDGDGVNDWDGFYLVGDLAIRGHGKPGDGATSPAAMALVRDVNGDSDCADLDPNPNKRPALCPPVGYTKMWRDDYGRLSEELIGEVSVWWPKAPGGYHCLGAIIGDLSSHLNWKIDKYRCVRGDLVVPTSLTPENYYPETGTHKLTEYIWSTYGRSGDHKELWVWGTVAPNNVQSGEANFSPGTFVFATQPARHTAVPAPKALRAPILNTREEEEPMALPPALSSNLPPFSSTEEVESVTTILPWFAVSDPLLNPISQLAISPTYEMTRYGYWNLTQWTSNRTETSQMVKWKFYTGTSGSESETYTKETGWDLGGGISFGKPDIFGINASAKYHQTITHSQESTAGWEEGITFELPVTIPPGKTVAAWTLNSSFKLFRKDGTQVSVTVPYKRDTIVFDQYPRCSKEACPDMNGGRIILENMLIQTD